MLTAAFDLDPTVVGSPANAQHAPSAAYGASGFQTVWHDARPTQRIYSSKLGASGPNDAQLLSEDFEGPSAPALGALGSGYLVVFAAWDQDGGSSLQAQLLDEDGGVVANIPLHTTLHDLVSPRVVSDGANYFVFWNEDRRNDLGAYLIRVRRISPTGSLLESKPIDVIRMGSWWYSAAWDGNRIVVFGQGLNSLPFLRWVTSEGEISKHVAEVPLLTYRHEIVPNGSGYLLFGARSDLMSHPTYDVYRTRLGSCGEVLDTVSLPGGDEDFVAHPAVVWTGRSFVVAWAEGSQAAVGGPFDAHFHVLRVDTAGNPLEQSSVEFLDAPPYNETMFPPDDVALASDGFGDTLILTSAYRADQPYQAARVSGRYLIESDDPVELGAVEPGDCDEGVVGVGGGGGAGGEGGAGAGGEGGTGADSGSGGVTSGGTSSTGAGGDPGTAGLGGEGSEEQHGGAGGGGPTENGGAPTSAGAGSVPDSSGGSGDEGGGTSSSGGSPSGTGGSGNAPGSVGGEAGTAEEDADEDRETVGCACTVPGVREQQSSGFALFALALASLVRRRRAHPRA